MTDKQAPDWERIEQLYRAGVLSVREIAATCGTSHTAINKRAKVHGWERDLKAKIQAKADALVSKAEVSKQVSTEQLETERGIVEANAKVIADIRIAHRTDIGRARRLANMLLDELEGLTEEQGTLKELILQLKEADGEGDADMSDVLALASKMSSLPSRTKTMKELGETLKNLITLERQAYDLGASNGDGDQTDQSLTIQFVKPNGN
ncbi:hypothetical protein D3C77_212690 [compost metagenome]